MDLIHIIPFKEAVFIAIGVSSLLTILLTVLIFRKGNKRRAGRIAADRAKEFAQRDFRRARESATDYAEMMASLNINVRQLVSTIDRLDTAVGRCIELSERLSDARQDGERVHIVYSPDPKPGEIKGRIMEMISSGISEQDISEDLNLSREQLRLYLHAGNTEKQKVVHL
ncbi:MAG: hypothetical protein B6D63_00400 [Candidatus Latescibacteria bacterium 4484_7]|nr:MAG: hypothetical protein B6D63_00400 [Candidatus Latescibacteria bacterium 4484_7]RKZ08727.1 MAG: hypothetical protein DRQ05_00965 [bacterium]